MNSRTTVLTTYYCTHTSWWPPSISWAGWQFFTLATHTKTQNVMYKRVRWMNEWVESFLHPCCQTCWSHGRRSDLPSQEKILKWRVTFRSYSYTNDSKINKYVCKISKKFQLQNPTLGKVHPPQITFPLHSSGSRLARALQPLYCSSQK